MSGPRHRRLLFLTASAYLFFCSVVAAKTVFTREIAKALRLINSRRVDERVWACDTLAALRSVKTINTLDRAARTDKSRDVRAAAARGLVKLGGEKARSTVSRLLRAESEDLRRRVLQAVIQAGRPGLGYMFMATADESQTVRVKALSGLARFGTARLVPILEDLSKDDDPFVRLETVRTITALAQKEPLSTGAVDGTTGPAATLGLALPIPEKVLRMTYDDLVFRATDLLRERVKDKAPSIRCAALEGLDKLNARGINDIVCRLLGDSDSHVRQKAIAILKRRDPGAALYEFRRLARHENSMVRADALEKLKEMGPAALNEMFVFLDDLADFIRRRAVEILAATHDNRVYPRLAVLLHDDNEEVRRLVARALGNSKLPVMAGRLGTALKDSSGKVRRAVVEALAKVGGPDVIGELTTVAHDDDASVRRAYIQALGKVGGVNAARLLLDQLCEPSTAYGNDAVDALRRVGKCAVGPLCSYLDRTRQNPLARQRIIRLLGEFRAKEAVGPLTAVLSSDDLTARSEAVSALQKIADPAALPSLERYFIDNCDLNENEEKQLKNALATLGRSFILDLLLRRYLLEVIVGLIGLVVLALGVKFYLVWAAVDAEAPAAVEKKIPESMEEIFEECRARINRSRDSAGLYFYRRGLVHYSQGNLVDAKRDLDEALRLCEQDIQPHILFILGHIFKARGDASYAFRMYVQALRIRNKSLLSELMSNIAAESPNDVEGNIDRILEHLPYHGECTVERILGKQPWLAWEERVRKKVPWEDDVEGEDDEPIEVAPVVDD